MNKTTEKWYPEVNEREEEVTDLPAANLQREGLQKLSQRLQDVPKIFNERSAEKRNDFFS